MAWTPSIRCPRGRSMSPDPFSRSPWVAVAMVSAGDGIGTRAPFLTRQLSQEVITILDDKEPECLNVLGIRHDRARITGPVQLLSSAHQGTYVCRNPIC